MHYQDGKQLPMQVGAIVQWRVWVLEVDGRMYRVGTGVILESEFMSILPLLSPVGFGVAVMRNAAARSRRPFSRALATVGGSPFARIAHEAMPELELSRSRLMPRGLRSLEPRAHPRRSSRQVWDLFPGLPKAACTPQSP
jgi:hypothetical protein